MISFEEFLTTIPSTIWVNMLCSEKGIDEERLKECYEKLTKKGYLALNEAAETLLDNCNWDPFGNYVGWSANPPIIDIMACEDAEKEN